MIKYRTDSVRWGVKTGIYPVHVERETEKSVWINGRRRDKTTTDDIYHDTWYAAHAYLLRMAEEQVGACRMRLEEAKGLLGNVKGMRRPE